MENRENESTGFGIVVLGLSLATVLLMTAYTMVLYSDPLKAQGNNSINNSGNVTIDSTAQSQNCGAAVSQSNNAVAERTATINAPVSVAQNCLQAGGSISQDADAGVAGSQYRADETTDKEGTTENDGTAPSDSSCLNPQELLSVGPGETENVRLPFDTSGTTFRVTYDVDFEDDSDLLNSFDIGIEDRDFASLDFAGETFDEDSSGSFVITDGPGSYNLVTDVSPDDGATYTITVDDCTEQAAGGGSDTANDDVQSGVAGQAIVPGSYDPNKVLANTGGPEAGTLATAPVSAVLIPAGVILVVCGLGAALWLGRSGFAGRG